MRLSFSERKAPPGKFRIFAVDTFSEGGDWVMGDVESVERAIKIMSVRTDEKSMLQLYCYDDEGTVRARAGKF